MSATTNAPYETLASLAVVRSVAALRAATDPWRREGRRIGLTPTMGALHDGHLSLLATARDAALGGADKVIATLFVNPTQFGEGEDFDSYPRNEARDAGLLAEAGCDLLFAPPPSEMYPPGFATEVRVTGLSEPLCGAGRPGHFDGVAQIVAKLLNQARADVAVFGQKDWQQLAIIRRMARDLDIDTEIIGAETVRAADGLALSSRNAYLSPEQRAIAPALFQAITAAASAIGGGADPAGACASAAATVEAAGFDQVEYLEARDADDLTPVLAASPEQPARVFAAAHLGRARLIDNVAIPSKAETP